jgi:hypothetical protein
VLEHVEMPWLWLPELERVCKVGGWFFIALPWQYIEHRRPVDCWRVLPDGMKVILKTLGINREVEVYIDNNWTIGLGRK